MDEFGTTKAELEEIMTIFHEMVRKVIEADTIQEKKKFEMEARGTLREARNALAALRAESRKTADPQVRAGNDAECQKFDEDIRRLDSEMKSQLYGSQKAQVRVPMTFQERREQELLGAGGYDGTGFTNSAQVLEAAANVQQDALEAVHRTERLANVTEEQGVATLAQLQRQTEQMYQIDEELQNLQGQLDRAARDVKWFYRQIASDKCMLAIFGICVLALLVLVFVSIWNKRK